MKFVTVLRRFQWPVEIHRVLAIPVDVRHEIRRGRGQHFPADRVPCLLQVRDRLGHLVDVVQDDHVGDQVVVLDDLALLVPHVFRDFSVVAKERPLCEAVELL